MSLIGYPRFDRRWTFESGTMASAFGGGAFIVDPSGYRVTTDGIGLVDWHLVLTRSLRDSDSRATFSCAIELEYPMDAALAAAREIDPAASVVPRPVADEWFRVLPTPALASAGRLTAPVPLAGSGLGTGRLLLQLPLDSGLLLEALLKGGGPLEAIAEVAVVGVSPQVPAVVRFDPTELLTALARRADVHRSLPFSDLIAVFREDVGALPLDITGEFSDGFAPPFAEAMADRVVARFGRFVPADDIGDAPLVELSTSDPGTMAWSLSQATLAHRRTLLRLDLLGAVREQVIRLGVDSVVERRDLAVLPPLGRREVTVLSMIPRVPAGVERFGVTLEFPAAPPHRPQPRTATALLGETDVTSVTVDLAPAEPLRYRYTTFAIVTSTEGARQAFGDTRDGAGDVLRLSSGDLPVELAFVSASAALVRLARIEGVCKWETPAGVEARAFTLDAGRLAVGLPVPRERTLLWIEIAAVARDSGARLPAGPFEITPVQLDLASFPAYGPHEAQIRCTFDDDARVRAVDLMPDGDAGAPAATTTLAFTPDEPMRTYRWSASSPFAPGYSYRAHGASGPWMPVAGGGDLDVRSSELGAERPAKEVAVRAFSPQREVARFASNGGAAPVRQESARRESARRESTQRKVARREAVALPAATETTVAPVGVSPVPVPDDECVFTRVDDATLQGYIPRYALDTQIVGGQPRYRVGMSQTESAALLTVGLVATVPPTPARDAPGATELPHSTTVALDFLVASGGGARKTLEFTEVTRSGAIVAASLTFATIAERDDVYGALVDRSRDARLLVRRYVDLLVPLGSTAPDVTDPMVVLPLPPIVDWPPFKLVVQEPVVLRDPILVQPLPIPKLPLPVEPWGKPPIVSRFPLASVNMIKAARLTEAAPVPRIRSSFFMKPIVASAQIQKFMRTSWKGGWVDLTPDVVAVLELPTPQLTFTGREGTWGRVCVTNWASFSDDFFARAPDLMRRMGPPVSRTSVDILDADTGTVLYNIMYLESGRSLSDLRFPMGDSPPAKVRVRLTDGVVSVVKVSNAVATTVAEPPERPLRPVRHELAQTLDPVPFAFSTDLHGYIFEGITPRQGSGELVRYRFPRGGRTHTYLQDATRPWVVYTLADSFKIARRPEPPFLPFATVRVRSVPDSTDTLVVMDYVVAPYTDPARLADARTRLLADPRFGADRVEFQPLLTSDVRFAIDRPSVSGAIREERVDAALVLQGWLKDTLSMPLADFRLLFDAMHRETASMFLGRVEIGVPNGDREIIPFTARMGDLQGEILVAAATIDADGTMRISLTNAIESSLDIHRLDAVVHQGDVDSTATVREGLPYTNLAPGETIEVSYSLHTPLPTGGAPLLTFDTSGVLVRPDPEAFWKSILDRSSVELFRTVTVEMIPQAVFTPAGPAGEHVVVVLVEFKGGGTARLTADAPVGKARIDYPVDDVILGRPVDSTYRYAVTVVYSSGRQHRDDELKEGTADFLFVSAPPPDRD